MRSNEKRATSPRPPASETAIRAMQDSAAVHRQAADEHEAQAQHTLLTAKRMADDMVRNAQEEAARIVRRAQEEAAESMRQAEARAAEIRTQAGEEEAGEAYWLALAAEERVRAGLPPAGPGDTLVASRQSAVETRTDPVAEQNGAPS